MKLKAALKRQAKTASTAKPTKKRTAEDLADTSLPKRVGQAVATPLAATTPPTATMNTISLRTIVNDKKEAEKQTARAAAARALELKAASEAAVVSATDDDESERVEGIFSDEEVGPTRKSQIESRLKTLVKHGHVVPESAGADEMLDEIIKRNVERAQEDLAERVMCSARERERRVEVLGAHEKLLPFADVDFQRASRTDPAAFADLFRAPPAGEVPHAEKVLKDFCSAHKDIQRLSAWLDAKRDAGTAHHPDEWVLDLEGVFRRGAVDPARRGIILRHLLGDGVMRIVEQTHGQVLATDYWTLYVAVMRALEGVEAPFARLEDLLARRPIPGHPLNLSEALRELHRMRSIAGRTALWYDPTRGARPPSDTAYLRYARLHVPEAFNTVERLHPLEGLTWKLIERLAEREQRVRDVNRLELSTPGTKQKPILVIEDDQEKPEEPVLPLPTRPETCNNCKRGGHRFENCPDIRCRRCKELGHIAKNCTSPKKSGPAAPAVQKAAPTDRAASAVSAVLMDAMTKAMNDGSLLQAITRLLGTEEKCDFCGKKHPTAKCRLAKKLLEKFKKEKKDEPPPPDGAAESAK